MLTMSRAAAVQCLLAKSHQHPPILVLHYFFEHPNFSALGLFKSLLRQALQFFIDACQACPADVVQHLEGCFGAENRIQDCREITEFLLQPLLSLMAEFTICIDGIQDCSHDEQQAVRTGLNELYRWRAFNLMFTGTADLDAFATGSMPLCQIRLDEGLNASAIQAYIDQRLLELAGTGQILEDETLRHWASRELSTKADGM